MAKQLVLIAVVGIALYRTDPADPGNPAKGTRIYIPAGATLPDDLTFGERADLVRMRAIREELVEVPGIAGGDYVASSAGSQSTDSPAGGDDPGTNTSAAEEGTDADVSGAEAATAASESISTSADAPTHSETGEHPPIGGTRPSAARKKK